MTIPPRSLPHQVESHLGAFLGRQRWYAGSAQPAADAVALESARLSWESADGSHRMWSVVASAEGARYHVLIGERPGGEPAEFLSGREDAVIGLAESSYFYDATVDPEMALRLLEVVTAGHEHAERIRHVSVEQSNTSLVYDDRIIVKVFRRLHDGPNPDIVVTEALAAAGFAQVATPVAAWREGDIDLAFAQEFLAGGSEGWALALTSLRDFYDGDTDEPAEAGGDFAAEAARLGSMTAKMHLAMAEAFGVLRGWLAAGPYPAMVDDISRRLDAVADDPARRPDAVADGTAPEPHDALAELRVAAVERLRSLGDPGPALRVHGDYHLGQVMRTDAGWHVLDFEGEPARAVAQRVAPSSPAKDVAGMLRSFHYAARYAMRERSASGDEVIAQRADRWEAHNRVAFTAGYHDAEGIASLLAPGRSDPLLTSAYELDKALYEADYERAYRPGWADIPLASLGRLLADIAGGASG